VTRAVAAGGTFIVDDERQGAKTPRRDERREPIRFWFLFSLFSLPWRLGALAFISIE
jgi:hypothetical protein